MRISSLIFVSGRLFSKMAEKKPPYELIDIGANLSHKSFKPKDLESVVERAKLSGVMKIMVTGTSVQGSKDALRLSRLYPGYLFSTAGVHPHEARFFTEETIAELETLALEKECVAVGECGLDFNRNFSPPEDQIRAFEAQVKLACRLQKPLFIHERDAHDEMKRILTENKADLPPAVIHCFTGHMEEAKAYLEMGLYIGLTGFLWKDKLSDGVQSGLSSGTLPLSRLMLETDSPFMFPKINAKKMPQEIVDGVSEHAKSFLFNYCSFNRNEPCALPAIAELIAGFAKVSAEEVAFHTSMNTIKVFSGLAQ